MRTILGISGFYHDSAAALLQDGRIVAAAQEERFSRRKNDERFPVLAVKFCLERAGLTQADVDAVVFYDKPIIKFARMLETYLAIAPHGIRTFPKIMPTWLAEKLNLRNTIRENLPDLSKECQTLFTEHHQSHAASAFYPSPFESAAILTIDGVGEWASTTIGKGDGNQLEMLKEIRFPHSLGLLYSAFTAYCGFRVNSGEYKMMGLAPYGEPTYADAILDNLIVLKDDGSFRLNLDYFDFLKGITMTNRWFHDLLGGPPRKPETELDPRFADIASSIQQVTTRVVLALAKHAREVTGESNLCLAGGVALNCVANGELLREKIFDQLWIQPAAGDAGGALGAALMVWHNQKDAPARSPNPSQDSMQGSLLGPDYTDAQIEATLTSHNAVFERLDDSELFDRSVEILSDEKVVGWFQGRLEYGPRALGNRSILGDPRSSAMQSRINRKIKFRESFRPFAPAVLHDHAAEWFEIDAPSPYMLLVAQVHARLRKQVDEEATGFDRLKAIRSEIPAVTHVDCSARVQTVDPDRNPRFHALLTAFEQKTGCPTLINTSFNVRGEPVVCSPDDAYRCFINTDMDYLILGNYVLDRSQQPAEKVETTFQSVLD